MRYWLMKSEPESFGIETLKQQRVAPWDGVRNYQARNFMRAMQVGDKVLFYHSNAKPSGVAGLAEVRRVAYPDLTCLDPSSKYYDAKSTLAAPRWDMVDVGFVAQFKRVLALVELRDIPELSDMLLFHNSRLSVQPIEAKHYAVIVKLAK
jgi:predicted RNA-binding protein with PUA-like domain